MSERIDYEALIARVDGWYNITSQNREDLLAALRHAATVEQAAREIAAGREHFDWCDVSCGDGPQCSCGLDALRAALAADGKEA